jgi:predicted nucleotide-binding protein
VHGEANPRYIQTTKQKLKRRNSNTHREQHTQRLNTKGANNDTTRKHISPLAQQRLS